ncbi:transforming growth factor beta-2 proprotein-like [Glandiceps talaboti]
MATKSRTLLAAIAVISLCLQVVTPQSCDLDADQFKTKRIEAIRKQILVKLGLPVAPVIDVPDVVPEDVIAMYNETKQLLKEQGSGQNDKCPVGDDDDDNQYATEVIRCEQETDWPESDDPYAIPKQDAGYSSFIQFDLSPLEDVDFGALTKAEIRLYQIPNTRASTASQRVELYQLQPPPLGSDVPGGRLLDTTVINPSSGGWITFDVTTVAKQWMIIPESNMGVELTVHCPGFKFDTDSEKLVHHDVEKLQVVIAGTPKQDELTITPEKGGRGRGDIPVDESYEGKNPYLLAFTKSPQANKRRKRRSLDASHCFSEPSLDKCCLRQLYVDFENDLGWKWIHSPKGYYANYCGGSCPHISSPDSHYYNRHASPAPCCVPKTFESFTMLYYAGGKPKVSQLTDMVLTSCRCS